MACSVMKKEWREAREMIDVLIQEEDSGHEYGR